MEEISGQRSGSHTLLHRWVVTVLHIMGSGKPCTLAMAYGPQLEWTQRRGQYLYLI